MDSLVAVDNVTATATTLLRNTILIPNNPHSTSDAKLRRKQKPCCVYNQQCNIHYAKNVFLPAHYFYINGVLITDFPKNPQHVFNNSGGAVTNIVTTPILLYMLPHNATVQLFLQDIGVIALENHPLHLHGFNFFEVG
ncbi:unnamed protein product [Brassica oleracea var. botrytis]|uniref:(rape) hypothetical protein n=1 Tax=Brassica napus TaxID=3708 RepID=A0A078FNP3_BRANA|nr:unnamed protein product [Brassica napus]CDY14492.1 BnaC03g21030D [Brassica napus]